MKCPNCPELDNPDDARSCISCGKSMAATGATVSLRDHETSYNDFESNSVVPAKRQMTYSSGGPGLMEYALLLLLTALIAFGLHQLIGPRLNQSASNPVSAQQTIDPIVAARIYQAKFDELQLTHQILGVVVVPDSSCKVTFDDNLDNPRLPVPGSNTVVETFEDNLAKSLVQVNAFCGAAFGNSTVSISSGGMFQIEFSKISDVELSSTIEQTQYRVEEAMQPENRKLFDSVVLTSAPEK